MCASDVAGHTYIGASVTNTRNSVCFDSTIGRHISSIDVAVHGQTV